MAATLSRDDITWVSVEIEIESNNEQPMPEANHGLFLGLLPEKVLWLFASAPDDLRYLDLYRAEAELLEYHILTLAEE